MTAKKLVVPAIIGLAAWWLWNRSAKGATKPALDSGQRDSLSGQPNADTIKPYASGKGADELTMEPMVFEKGPDGKYADVNDLKRMAVVSNPAKNVYSTLSRGSTTPKSHDTSIRNAISSGLGHGILV